MPVVTMFSGPNGSGKSTLKAQHQALGIDFGDWVNADEIAAAMAGAPDAVAAEAQLAARMLREELLAAGADYCFETVMSHHSHLEHLADARSRGYFVNIVYVAIDNPLANVSRVALRVAKGGHDVPPDRIVARWHRSIALLPDALALADAALVYDNSNAREPYVLLARKEDGVVSLLRPAGELPSWFAACLPGLRARNMLPR